MKKLLLLLFGLLLLGGSVYFLNQPVDMVDPCCPPKFTDEAKRINRNIDALKSQIWNPSEIDSIAIDINETLQINDISNDVADILLFRLKFAEASQIDSAARMFLQDHCDNRNDLWKYHKALKRLSKDFGDSMYVNINEELQKNIKTLLSTTAEIYAVIGSRGICKKVSNYTNLNSDEIFFSIDSQKMYMDKLRSFNSDCALVTDSISGSINKLKEFHLSILRGLVDTFTRNEYSKTSEDNITAEIKKYIDIGYPDVSENDSVIQHLYETIDKYSEENNSVNIDDIF